MNDDAAAGKSEIVIVRRRGGDDEGSHGHGAWKIAYADFVTAMMAFFLVMWLINASNEETRAQVASYFNPIKLTDNSTGARGLKEPKDSKSTPGSEAGSPPSKADVRHEAELMANPQGALDRIEKKHEANEGSAAGGVLVIVQESPSTRADESNPGVGDPFDPESWEKVTEEPVQAKTPKVPEKKPDAPAGEESDSPFESVAQKPEPASEPRQASSAEPGPKSDVPLLKPMTSLPDKTSTHDPASNAAEDLKQAEVKAREGIAAAIRTDIAKSLGTGLEDLPQSIDVKNTDDGILISLTDQQSFGMFKTGSAEPELEMVKLVDAIARALDNRAGYLVVRGHTDSRPYRNKRYDNWQLSSARAHFAQYMLIRGGVDEKRIRRIEGVADRSPRNKDDPQAPENRRIEILLGLDGE